MMHIPISEKNDSDHYPLDCIVAVWKWNNEDVWKFQVGTKEEHPKIFEKLEDPCKSLFLIPLFRCLWIREISAMKFNRFNWLITPLFVLEVCASIIYVSQPGWVIAGMLVTWLL